MELFSPAFFSALLAIIIIDLVLAGDNAIVIALAARSVPSHLRKRAILWGTVGAVAVRIVMTLAVVWLLQVPWLQFAGGLLLVWIAWRLLVPDAEQDHQAIGEVGSFWAAMKTIIIADAIMGLDNMLAVAGAAHGSFLLVTLGLLISIPIMIWGSTLILKLVERYRFIVYVGAGVLAWTAVKMMTGDDKLKAFFAENQGLTLACHAAVIGGVLGLAYMRERRARSGPSQAV
jgi:YjbE family integral membrane protein